MLSPRAVLPALLLTLGCGSSVEHDWPPTVGQRYPELELRNLDGERVALSSFAGNVLLIDPIGMT